MNFSSNMTTLNSSDPNGTDSSSGSSSESYDQYYYVEAICYPIMLAFGTVGNILSLVILSRMKPKTSTSVYLTFVAVADMFVLEVLSTRTALFTECILLFLCGVFNVYSLTESYYCIQMHPLDDPTMSLPVNLPDCRDRTAWLTTWYPLQERAEMGNSVFKYVLIAAINSAISCNLYHNWNAQESLFRDRLRSLKGGGYAYMKSNIILCASTLLYLTTQLPATVFKALIYAKTYNAYPLPDSVAKPAAPFITQLQLLNYSLNFYLYFAVSQRFREELLLIWQEVTHTKPVSAASKTSYVEPPIPLTLILPRGTSEISFVSEGGEMVEVNRHFPLPPIPERDQINEADCMSKGSVSADYDLGGLEPVVRYGNSVTPPRTDKLFPRFSIGKLKQNEL
ncbi:hypothetical protein BV898_09085 [Hypsibius exemplaris]|uniref:G-protein coupled receptors family 1 profile domain-containing protein n=1 Tax=Hypsibius exemplaris TaxID=2072580 RepID=A0A1W0WNJ0_HYPEX|nr:hypothetical protein BV898_09085 [Hypsibius exemplaris]